VANWYFFERPGLHILLMKLTDNRARTRRLAWIASKEDSRRPV
jgi:hypothetical protein